MTLAQSQLCDFDQIGWNYSLSTGSGATALIQSGTPFWPINGVYGSDASQALAISGGEVNLFMDPMNTQGTAGSYFTFNVGAVAESGSGKGMDKGSDYIEVYWRTSTQQSWSPCLRLRGNRNAHWDLQKVGMLTQVDASDYKDILPFEGGLLTAGALNAFVIDGFPEADSLFIRLRLYTDRSNEVWALDDLEFIQPQEWTNQAGDRLASNPLNWSGLSVPSINDAVYLSDSSSWSAWIDTLRVARLITDISDTFDLRDFALRTGQWHHMNGYVHVDSLLTLNSDLGAGTISGERLNVIGNLTIAYRPETLQGWRHLSSPLITRWGDFTEDIHQVMYGTGGSIYAWDAQNAAWYTVNDGSYTTRNTPIAIYGGAGWLDSAKLVSIVGKYSHIGDTAWMEYGIPTANSPFGNVAGNEGWNFVGNPYPFPISLDSLFASADWPSNAAPTAYIWSTEDQTYRSYNSSTGAFGGATPIIHSWQGFWVQLTSSGPSQTPLVISPSMGGEVSGDALQKRSISSSVFTVRNGSDSARVKLVEVHNARERWDAEYDHKWRGNRDTEVYLLAEDSLNDVRVSVKSLDPIHPGGIPLFVRSIYGGKVEIALKGDDVWWLEDPTSQSWRDLSKGPWIGSFGKGEMRKYRLWRKHPLSLDEEEVIRTPTYENGLVDNSTSETWELFDMAGRRRMGIAPHSRAVQFLSAGIYVWRSSQHVVKVVIQSIAR